jgi:lipopolysaccharide transport system ATP-binding protein
MSEVAIRVDHLSKLYHIGKKEKSYKMLRESLTHTFQKPFQQLFRKLQPGAHGSNDTIWALKDVSFEVKRGEVVGIIGSNGAGKSTLLKILSRITEPTEGNVEIRGRVGSLLEVGTGFHSELTGRENIYLNAAILGMRRREIQLKFDQIVSFSEIEKFIDTPVKHYSSGMYIRLAFAVAAHLDPEILIVDEVLAVGDVAFQKKCLGKMGDVARGGRTVLFVSHNVAAMQQLVRRCILLRAGRMVVDGDISTAVSEYLSYSLNDTPAVYYVDQLSTRDPDLSRKVELVSLELEKYSTRMVPADADIVVKVKVRGNEIVSGFRFSMTILKMDGTSVGNFFGPEDCSINKDEVATYRIQISDLRLARGVYYCAVAVGLGNHLKERVEFDVVTNVLYFEIMPPVGTNGTISEWYPHWGAIRFKEPRVVRIE